MSGLVRIPRHLLHVELEDLERLGVPAAYCAKVRAFVADLPAVPEAPDSAQFVGRLEVTLPALAVVARRVGQALRDYNIAVRNADRERLRAERRKLGFVDADALLSAPDGRYSTEAALFVVGATEAVAGLLREREAHGRVSFVAVEVALEALAHWRRV